MYGLPKWRANSQNLFTFANMPYLTLSTLIEYYIAAANTYAQIESMISRPAENKSNICFFSKTNFSKARRQAPVFVLTSVGIFFILSDVIVVVLGIRTQPSDVLM